MTGSGAPLPQPRLSWPQRVKALLRSLLTRDSAPWRATAGLQYAFRCLSAAWHYGRLRGKYGLEIGGPTGSFRDGVLPVYRLCRGLDGCNFSDSTVWEGRLEQGQTFRYLARRPAGRQYILEATDLSAIPDAAYDFVISSHTIEHTANPLKALLEWQRVMKPGGLLLLVAPHRDGVSEQLRPFTTLEHLERDFELGTGEDDPTHIPGLLKWLDERTDAPAQEIAQYKKNLENFHGNRALHHHVFDTALAAALVDRAGMKLLSVRPLLPCHIAIFAQKAAPPELSGNAAHFGPGAPWRRRSPFPSDWERRGVRDTDTRAA